MYFFVDFEYAHSQALHQAFIKLILFNHPHGSDFPTMQARANAFMQNPDIIEIKSCQYHQDSNDLNPVISIVYTARQEVKE